MPSTNYAASIYGGNRGQMGSPFIDKAAFKSKEIKPVLLQQYEKQRVKQLADELMVTGSTQLASAFNKLQEQSLTQMRKFLSVNEMRNTLFRIRKQGRRPVAPTPNMARAHSPES